MNDLFYRAFEERYYAPRQFIRKLRKQYLPFVEPLREIYPNSATFDLGCGRGEWIELMLEAGFQSFGVDLDKGMLEDCRLLQLPAHQGDAVEHLSTLPDNSHAVISAFHVVEHISFEQLTQVVIHSLRVLKPGGLLIMETPNPENIVVGTQNFYIDPTHQRPLPTQLLSFLPEHYGFSRTKVLRLQESKTLLQGAELGLFEVFSGVSPDYAVVAQKHAKTEVLEKFDVVFAKDFGLSLPLLCSHYDARITAKIDSLQSQTSQLEAQINASKNEVDQSRITAQTVQNRLDQLEASFNSAQKEAENARITDLKARLEKAEARAHRCEHEAQAAIAEVHAVHESTSWRITAPMRWLGTQFRLLRMHGLRARVLALYRKIWLGTPQERSAQPINLGAASTEVTEPPPTPAQDPMSTRVRRTFEELQEHVKKSDKVRR